MTAIIPTLLKKEEMTIEQLAGASDHIIIKLGHNLYKVMPSEALLHPEADDWFTQYCDKRELRKVMEDLYDQKQKDKTPKK